MWNKSTRNDIQDMFDALVVPDSREDDLHIWQRSGKGGKRPVGYERRPHRAAYKREWLARNREAVNARRRAARVA